MGVVLFEEAARMVASRRQGSLLQLGLIGVLFVAFGVGVSSSSALAAEPPPILWGGVEEPACPTGSGAGQCDTPRGVAADPRDGHIYVAEQENNRVVEFNALGQFIKAWGWGVVASGSATNETQTVEVDATGGSFRLKASFLQTTTPIPFNASAAEVQAALEGLNNNGFPEEIAADPGDFSVSGSPGDWEIEFTGANGDIDIRQLECLNSLTGGAASCTVTTAQQGGGFEICIPENGDVCRAGQPVSSPGGFNDPQGVAVDSSGHIYVTDRLNHRVEKFDREGNFVLAFGSEGTGPGQFGPEWPIGDFITIDENETATDVDDKVYVGDVDRIQRFDTVGVFQDECSVSSTVRSLTNDAAGNLYAVLGGAVHKLSPTPNCEELPPDFNFPGGATAVAVDSEENVYAFRTPSPGTDPIVQLNPKGEVTAQFGKDEFSASTGLATNLCPESEPPGNLYVTNASSADAFLRAYGTEPIGCGRARTLPASNIAETSATLNGTVNPKGGVVTECFFEFGTTIAYGTTTDCEESPASIGTGSSPVPVHLDIAGLQKGTIYHFRLIAEVGGETETGADENFKTFGPPTISDDHTAAVIDTEATLKALVNPEGFATDCSFEYGLDDNYGQSTPTIDVGKDKDTSQHQLTVNLKKLTPGTTYHWQLVCGNSSGTTESADHAFATYAPFEAGTCPEQAFRTGASAFLPDCRAYEMVSPVDKNGGDIISEMNSAGNPGGWVQIAPNGNSLTYTSIAAFADTPSTFRLNQYLTERHERGESEEGWPNHGIRPPVEGRKIVDDPQVFGFFREFMAFSPDLCSAWLIDYQAPPPTAEGQEGKRNLYRRDNCGAGAGDLEALIPFPKYEVPGGIPLGYIDSFSVQGYSADSRHAIFTAGAKLNLEAAEGGGTQLYDRFCPTAASVICHEDDPSRDGSLTVVSVLPDGKPGDPAGGDGKGFPVVGGAVGSGALGNLVNAVSEDGSRVYWSSNQIFVRLRPEQGIVPGEYAAGKCSAPATVACTIQVSASTATFRAATPDGSKALYEAGDDLHVFDLEKAENGEPQAPAIATDVLGVPAASEDLSRIYFVSEEALGGENGEEDEAVAGEPNLYLAEGGGVEFVGTLVDGDVGRKEPGATVLAYDLLTQGTYERATRTTPTGSHLAFESRAPLTGYDNTGPDGRPAVEVFLYQAGGELTCASCNPSGARPNEVEGMQEPYTSPWELGRPTNVPAAAFIPTWEHSLHASNVLSTSGNRLFFNSFDALLPRDNNSAQDVYEWEAPGTGGCDAEDPSFFSDNGGCVYLISTGESSFESTFWEASPDGRDVFFTTEQGLLPRDPGSIDLYDARVDGGFPEPVIPEICEGEACQDPPPPPEFPTPASSSYSGPGDPPPPANKCPKGKHKVKKGGKTRCAKKKKGKGKSKGKQGKQGKQRATGKSGGARR